MAAAVVAAVLAVGQQALHGYEVATAAVEVCSEEVDRLSALVAKLRRDKSSEEEARKDCARSATGALGS